MIGRRKRLVCVTLTLRGNAGGDHTFEVAPRGASVRATKRRLQRYWPDARITRANVFEFVCVPTATRGHHHDNP